MVDVDVSLRREIGEELEKKSKKKKEKKRKAELADASLRREIQMEQEQQELHHHSQQENAITENNNREKKRSKKKKRTEEPDVSLHREIEKQAQQEEDRNSQEENPHTENNKREKKRRKEKKRKEEPNMEFDVILHREIETQARQEEDQLSLEEKPNTESDKGEKEMNKKKKKKRKKRKEEPNMDVDASLHREIKEKQELQEGEQHSQEESPHTESNKGEKKRRKRKKWKEEGDQHSDEGNLLTENDEGEEKRSKKKKEKKMEEKVENPSQKIPQQFSCADHEQRKLKKARKLRHLAKENGLGAEGVVYEAKKMAKKPKQVQDILCKSGDEEGSNPFVQEDENASYKAMKHSKKSRSSVQGGSYDPAANDDLLNNNMEYSKEPLAEQIEHVTKTSVAADSSPKENEKEKKKERKRKRVTFQDQIKVADQEHVRDIPNAACENSTGTVEEVWGVRFTTEEDEILKDAVWKYIKSKGWDEQEGLNKVFNSMKHKDARNCWADINLCLPHRPRQAIRYRAHLLLEKGAHAGKWSEDEEQLLRRLQGEHGNKWKEITSLLDRHRTSIKEKWRSLKRTKGKGVWTQGELQQLSDMVHKCLRAKASIPVKINKPNRHILRDDINWEKIADTLGTHNHGSCCGKWYYNLQSSLVTDGIWANADDFLLLQSLLESGACVEEEVEWDSLLDHRPGQVCSTRWKQMVKHLGENRTRQFLDKLDILARRYAPELLESSVN